MPFMCLLSDIKAASVLSILGQTDAELIDRWASSISSRDKALGQSERQRVVAQHTFSRRPFCGSLLEVAAEVVRPSEGLVEGF